jgi:hypothetical protein
MHLWHRILPQAVITLNMLRTSRINPKLSAATHIFGQHDYKIAPMAPPGTVIIAHETPGRRQTWAPHGQDGWYIGPSLEHYRCYTAYITKTRSTRIVETVNFFSASIQNTIPFIKRFGSAGWYRINSRIIKATTGGPIFSGRRRTGDHTKEISNNIPDVKTKESEQTTYPPK